MMKIKGMIARKITPNSQKASTNEIIAACFRTIPKAAASARCEAVEGSVPRRDGLLTRAGGGHNLTIRLVNSSMSARPSKALSDERRGARSRAAILGAAERIFADVGLAGARTDAIAAAAGVNKALLYYYFKSKDALYLAVLEDHLGEFYRCGLEVLSKGRSTRATLVEYVSMHFDFISSRPYYPRLLQRFMMAGGRPLERLAQKYFLPLGRELGRVIERGVRTGELREVDSHHTAISLVALTAFYFSAAPIVRLVSRIEPYEAAQLARRKEEVLDFIRYGLFRNPEARWS